MAFPCFIAPPGNIGEFGAAKLALLISAGFEVFADDEFQAGAAPSTSGLEQQRSGKGWETLGSYESSRKENEQKPAKWKGRLFASTVTLAHGLSMHFSAVFLCRFESSRLTILQRLGVLYCCDASVQA